MVEGAFTVFVGGFSYFLVPDWPETARFLSAGERKALSDRLSAEAHDASMNHWSKNAARRIFGDLKIWLG